MRVCVTLVISAFLIAACATPEEREIAALEEELGLNNVPYFPKCLSEEVSPRAAVRARDYNVSHTVNNPQGDVPLDKCVRWETDEPPGKSKEKPKKLVFTQSKDSDSPVVDTTEP